MAMCRVSDGGLKREFIVVTQELDVKDTLKRTCVTKTMYLHAQ